MNQYDPNQYDPNQYDPNQPPPSYQPPGEPALGYAWNPTHRQRGGCLTAFLVLMMIANPIIALVYVFGQDFIKKGMPHAPDWAFPVLTVAGLVNLVFAIGIWNWKKWGVIGSITMAAIIFPLNLYIGVPAFNAIMGLGGPALLIFLVKPLWRGFE
jgi:hypothetical protein